MAVETIQVPDIGDEQDAEVIEVLVSPGDEVSENDSLITLESDKAAMEIPSPKAGVVKDILVKVGDKVSQGADIVSMETAAAGEGAAKVEEPAPEEEKAPVTEEPEVKEPETKEPETKEPETKEPEVKAQKETTAATEPAVKAQPGGVQEVRVPDLGEDSDVDVIDILVAVGDAIKKEDGLITLESDKAAMDVPSPADGIVKAIKVKVGDKVSEGSVILDLETETTAAPAPEKPAEKPAAKASPEPEKTATPTEKPAPAPTVTSATPQPATGGSGEEIYAGPAVRKMARELGVDLGQIGGTGARGRILKEDVEAYVKGVMQGGGAAATPVAGGLPGIEDIDFSQFGEIEEEEMPRLHQLTARNMSRNWLNIPHVTQFDEADVTDLEDFREAQKAMAEKKGIKLTPLPFIVKACAQALKEYPQFNVSLHSSGTKLIRKKYVNIGVAVATPHGLVVPVVKNADHKSIWEIAAEIADLGNRAKERKLPKEDMQGSCFTVSSLGNLGGIGFTPIVNAPEVAILGVSRTQVKPVYVNDDFVPRKMLPFSLSYDHRAVNGVDGGMFCTYLGTLLNDIRLLAL